MKATCSLEQARAQLSQIAAEARAGHPSVITGHGEPMVAVVPVSFLRAQQASRVRKGGVLALRGAGRDTWAEGAARAVADLRDEWYA